MKVRKNKAFLALLLIIYVFSPTILWARWWHNSSIAKDLNLKADQVLKIDKIYNNFLKERKAIAKEIRNKWKALDAQFDNPDKKSIESLLNEICDLRYKLLKKMIETKIEIKSVLTKKQISVLKEKHPELLSFSSLWGWGKFRVPMRERKTHN